MPVEEDLMRAVLLTFGTAMVPVLELRGAIPVGVAAGLSPAAACAVSVLGNMVPVPFILLLIRRIFDFLRGTRIFGPKIQWLERRAHLKGRVVRKYRLPGLIILVAIPLPGTGAWTGALVAALLDIRMRHAVPAIFLGVVIAGAIGTFYGAIAGYVGGRTDNIMMRISEMILSFPSLILAMIINAVMGSNLFNTMFALVIVAWPTYARLMRSVVLSVKENEYVTASKALGASKLRILIKEVIPNSISSVLIMATTDIGNQILMFSTLSFLGLGSAPPTPEWGMMVSEGVNYFNKFWVAGFPGLAIFTMAVGANFIGDGLRDLLDPKLRKEF